MRGTPGNTRGSLHGDVACHAGLRARQGQLRLRRSLGSRQDSHLANAIAQLACLRGHRVRFVTAADLVNDLVAAQARNGLHRRLAPWGSPDLLLVDELGYLTFDSSDADLLYQVFNRRYQRASTAWPPSSPGPTSTSPASMASSPPTRGAETRSARDARRGDRSTVICRRQRTRRRRTRHCSLCQRARRHRAASRGPSSCAGPLPSTCSGARAA